MLPNLISFTFGVLFCVFDQTHIFRSHLSSLSFCVSSCVFKLTIESVVLFFFRGKNHQVFLHYSVSLYLSIKRVQRILVVLIYIIQAFLNFVQPFSNLLVLPGRAAHSPLIKFCFVNILIQKRKFLTGALTWKFYFKGLFEALINFKKNIFVVVKVCFQLFIH